MKLFEVLDSTVPYEWISRHTAEFNMGRASYEVSLYVHPINGAFKGPEIEQLTSKGLLKSNDSLTAIEFVRHEKGQQPSHEITNTGNSFAVMATVIAIATEGLKHKKPEFVGFHAKEPSRVKLYKRLAKLVTSIGYDLIYSGDSAEGQGWLFKLKTPVSEAKDFTPTGQVKHKEIKYPNMMDKIDFGKNKGTETRDVVVRGSNGKVYGRRSVTQSIR